MKARSSLGTNKKGNIEVKKSMIDFTKDVLQILLQLVNIVIIAYGFYKFINKPHDTLEEKHEALKRRVDEHDLDIKEIKKSLLKGNDKFREQAKTNTAFQSVMLCFVNFEIAYCLHTDYRYTEELLKAKSALENYINREKKEEGYGSD